MFFCKFDHCFHYACSKFVVLIDFDPWCQADGYNSKWLSHYGPHHHNDLWIMWCIKQILLGAVAAIQRNRRKQRSLGKYFCLQRVRNVQTVIFDEYHFDLSTGFTTIDTTTEEGFETETSWMALLSNKYWVSERQTIKERLRSISLKSRLRRPPVRLLLARVQHCPRLLPQYYLTGIMILNMMIMRNSLINVALQIKEKFE